MPADYRRTTIDLCRSPLSGRAPRRLDLRLQRNLTLVAHDADRHIAALDAPQRLDELLTRSNLLTVRGGNHIARLHAGARRRRIIGHRRYENAVLRAEVR